MNIKKYLMCLSTLCRYNFAGKYFIILWVRTKGLNAVVESLLYTDYNVMFCGVYYIVLYFPVFNVLM